MSGVVRLVHRHVWQRLPRRLRRHLLLRTTSRIAPRLARKPDAAGPVIVVGPLSAASGLGQSARLCHDALAACGYDVRAIDITGILMQRRDVAEFAGLDARRCQGPGTLLVHVNAPMLPLVMARLGRRVVAEKRVIGYWQWELPRVPAEWRHGIPFVHEVWVPSRFTADAIWSLSGTMPVAIVPHPIATGRSAPAEPRVRGAGEPFTVLTLFDMASSLARKNPAAAIAAFRRAFGDDPAARLIVKMSNGDLFPDGARQLKAASTGQGNVTLVDAVLSGEALEALYGAADVVLSLHRSEGFGLVIAEAMLRARPVIATDWSGNTDFFDGRHGVPVGFRLVPAQDAQGTYDHADLSWAEADIAQAAEALRRLRADPAEAARLGHAGARAALAAFGDAAYAAAVTPCLQSAARRPETA